MGELDGACVSAESPVPAIELRGKHVYMPINDIISSYRQYPKQGICTQRVRWEVADTSQKYSTSDKVVQGPRVSRHSR